MLLAASDSLEHVYLTKGSAFSGIGFFVQDTSVWKKKKSRYLILAISSLTWLRDRSYRLLRRRIDFGNREQRRRAYVALVSCTPGVISGVCRGNFWTAREPLANDVLSLSIYLYVSGDRRCRRTARYVTSRQRRSEHDDDDASALASSSSANWLHLRHQQASPSPSEFGPGLAQADENQLRPLDTTIRDIHSTPTSDWSVMLKIGVAKPERRQIWPWNGCGAAFACGEALLSLLLLLLPALLPLAGWLVAAVVAGNRLVVPPPLPPPPTPPPQPPASLHLTRYRSHGVAGDERVDCLAKCHRFQGIFTFRAREVFHPFLPLAHRLSRSPVPFLPCCSISSSASTYFSVLHLYICRLLSFSIRNPI